MAEAHHAMTLRDMITSLNKADILDETVKTRACLAMSYPKQQARLTLPAQLEEFDHGADEQEFENALRASGLLPIVEHLYPHPTSQQQ
jgi:hypothetical protein